MADEHWQDDRINAYVDGALNPQQAAHMAAAIARDPALARRVARYQALRSGVASLGAETVIIAIPERSLTGARSGRLSMALAACAVVIAAGAAWWSLAGYPDAAGGPTLTAMSENPDLTAMIAHFDAWVAQPTDGPTEAPVDGIALLLQANGLRQTSSGIVNLPVGHQALAQGFVGASDCHVSLYTRDDIDDLRPGITMTNDGQILLAQWAGAHQQVTMISRSMDATRFAILALALQKATDAHGESHPELLASLAHARQPCLG